MHAYPGPADFKTAPAAAAVACRSWYARRRSSAARRLFSMRAFCASVSAVFACLELPPSCMPIPALLSATARGRFVPTATNDDDGAEDVPTWGTLAGFDAGPGAGRAGAGAGAGASVDPAGSFPTSKRFRRRRGGRGRGAVIGPFPSPERAPAEFGKATSLLGHCCRDGATGGGGGCDVSGAC